MKKVLLAIFLVMFVSFPAFAAWTVSAKLVSAYDYGADAKMMQFSIAVTSDASSSGDITLSDELRTTYGTAMGNSYVNQMKGGILYAVEYVPDGTDTPTTAGRMTIDTAYGTNIFDETISTAGTGEVFDGTVDSNFNVPLTDVIFACTTLANTKKATFYIWIIR